MSEKEKEAAMLGLGTSQLAKDALEQLHRKITRALMEVREEFADTQFSHERVGMRIAYAWCLREIRLMQAEKKREPHG